MLKILKLLRDLTHQVRDIRAGYQQTLDVLAESKRINPKVLTKTSIILGLGDLIDRYSYYWKYLSQNSERLREIKKRDFLS